MQEAKASARSGVSQGPPRGQARARNLLGAGLSQRPLPEQVRGSDFHRNRYKGATAKGAGLRQRPMWDWAWVRDLQGGRLEPATSAREGPRQRPQQSIPKQAISIWAVPNNLQDYRTTPTGAERSPGTLNDLRETGTVALTAPWGATIWTLDPLAP